MTIFARIINNIAVDVTANPSVYHPSLACTFVHVPDNIQDGWIFTPSTNTWVSPTPPVIPMPIPPPLILSTPDFWLCFTTAEEIAIRAAGVGNPTATPPIASDETIATWLRRLDDPRTLTINLSLAGIAEALTYLTSKGLLASGRQAQILAGTAQ